MYNYITNTKTKVVYWDLINTIVKQPTAIQHWIEEFPFLHDNDFDDFFLIAHKNSEVKLQYSSTKDFSMQVHAAQMENQRFKQM